MTVSAQGDVSYAAFSTDQVDLFNKWIENHRPYVSYTAEELAEHRDMAADNLRELSRYWTELSDEPVNGDAADQLRDAFNIDITIYGAAEYADVHPAQAWGYWQRNKDGLGSFPREPQRTELQPGDDTRLDILSQLNDGDDRDTIVSTLDQPAVRVEPVIDTYEANTEKYREKKAAGVIDGN